MPPGQFCHTCIKMLPIDDESCPDPPHASIPIMPDAWSNSQRTVNPCIFGTPKFVHSAHPPVEDEIKRKDPNGTDASLGRFSQRHQGKGQDNDEYLPPGRSGGNLEPQLAIWRLRGALWWITLLCVMACHSVVVLGYNFPHILERVVPFLPLTVFLSLLYTAWDPTYYSFKKARIQGRDVRVRGKGRYIAVSTDGLVLQTSDINPPRLAAVSRGASSICLSICFYFVLWHAQHTV
ncbi:hypothetical protein EDD16DRAFT_81923 [Pisolithus croceorrhizus]|nr:hypothetical protein EDD16DRAFT_81923 [Pisolithus croceorrhizus]